ncbi:MAG: hypothetical protein KIT78_01045 [Steroidobacteraceae bacterium]|nr:hypothetical protein [Steroidobacteraceae bacterium]
MPAAKVERIIANQSLVELSQRVEALEWRVRDLHGRTGGAENAVEAARKQQRDLADLDSRLSALEGGAGTVTPAAPLPGPAAAASAGAAGRRAPPPLGAAAAARLRCGVCGAQGSRYAGGDRGLRGLLAASPEGTLAPNAQYWLGEAYYVTRDYECSGCIRRGNKRRRIRPRHPVPS